MEVRRRRAPVLILRVARSHSSICYEEVEIAASIQSRRLVKSGSSRSQRVRRMISAVFLISSNVNDIL